MSDKAVSSGKVTAAQVAHFVFDAIGERRFYIYSHPKSLASVQTRLEDIMLARNPTDPFADKPEIGEELRAALRARADREIARLQQPTLTACTGRPLSASTITRLTLADAPGRQRAGLKLQRRAAALRRPGGHRPVVAHDEVVVQGDAWFSPALTALTWPCSVTAQ